MKKVIGLIACFSIAVLAQNEQEQHPSQQTPQAAPPPQQQQQQAYPPQQQYQYPPQQAVPQQYQQQQGYPPPQQLQPVPVQENCVQEQPGIKFGVRAGLNLSSLSAEDNDFSLGWQIGVVADIGSKYFFFHPGIMLIGKGSEYSVKPVEATASMYYIEAPLLISFKPIPEFRIDVGHYVSYGLFGTTETTVTVNNNSVSDKTKSFDNFHDFDFGLSFGVGVEIKQYYVGLNYEFGLTDIATEGTEEINNQTWALTFGYNF